MQQEKERDFSKLLLSKWTANDIADFYGIGLSYANEIKTKVQNMGYVAPIDEGKERKSVIADKVIQVMGGKDRLTEIQILNELRQYEGDK